MSKRIQIALTSTGLLLLNSAPVWAAGFTDIRVPTTSVTQFSITSIGQFIGAILSLLFIIAGILVFVYLVWGGLQWLTSGGDKGATQAARDRITAALVGLAIIAIAYAIVQLIQYFFGVQVVGTGAVPKPY